MKNKNLLTHLRVESDVDRVSSMHLLLPCNQITHCLRLIRKIPASQVAAGLVILLLCTLFPTKGNAKEVFNFDCAHLTGVVNAATLVRGTVTSSTSETLPGVTVSLKGTTTRAVTDAKGNYSINIPEGQNTLVFSYIGYALKEVSVSDQIIVNVVLIADVKSLNEVVIVGYGTQKRGNILGSVSSVSEKDFKDQPVTRIDQVLQGRTAGVQVTNAGGAPGGDVRIRVRGTNSLSGENDPLYVIDGYVGADFSTVNPQDVSSLEVLKDASATAIYGSRGANGVIIITTKKGRSGEMKVEASQRFYSSQVIKKQETLSAIDFATTANERAVAIETSPVFTSTQLEDIRKNGGTNWQDQIFRRAPGQESQVTASGGNEKINYLISGNYLNQDGIIRNSDFKRYALRANLGSKVSEKFALRFNFFGTRKENMNTAGTTQRSGPLAQALAWAPTTPLMNSSGTYTLRDPVGSIFANPLNIISQDEYRSLNTNANVLSGFNYKIITGLSFDVQLGLNYLNSQGLSFQGEPSSLGLSYAGRGSGESITLQNTNSLSYTHTFNQNHRLDVTAVFETQKFTGTQFNINAVNLTYPEQTYNNIAVSKSNTIGSNYANWALLSQLGRLNYSFKEKYLLTASIRRDGSSKFPKNNRYSVFPSVALGWRISNESFLKNSSIINNLKLRASWGLTGNQGISPYGSISQYVTQSTEAGSVFNGQDGALTPGIIFGDQGNSNLKWETTEQVDIGADLEVLKGRITLSADYFDKNTRDVLMYKSLPQYAGGYQIQSNIGQLQNKGWEASLGIVPVRSTNFEWNTAFNISKIKNKMVSLNGERDTILFNYSPNVLIVGQSINSLWGLNYLGTWKPGDAAAATLVNAKPGDAHYEDLNSDGIIDGRDYKVIGNGIPKFSLGWNNTFAYKGLSLNIFVQGLFGFDKLNYTYANGMLGSSDARQVIFSDIKDRYKPGVNESSNIPAFSTNSANSLIQTSRFIEKGDFIRLKNLSLAYDIPKSLIKSSYGIRVFVSTNNLFTITKYKGIDPESNSSAVAGVTWDKYNTDITQGVDFASYPNSKTTIAGINLTF